MNDVLTGEKTWYAVVSKFIVVTAVAFELQEFKTELYFKNSDVNVSFLINKKCKWGWKNLKIGRSSNFYNYIMLLSSLWLWPIKNNICQQLKYPKVFMVPDLALLTIVIAYGSWKGA